jgi:hypothetical protein
LFLRRLLPSGGKFPLRGVEFTACSLQLVSPVMLGPEPVPALLLLGEPLVSASAFVSSFLRMDFCRVALQRRIMPVELTY